MARLAKSLSVLRTEINTLAPNRSKASDGWIGDPAHASRASRHNPNAEGVVCALDITDDPANGCPIHVIARMLVERLQSGGKTNPDFEYVISNRQIAKRSTGWIWETYTGSNPHTKHAHFAVGRGPDRSASQPYDTTTPWNVSKNSGSPETGEEDVEMFAVQDGPEAGKVFLVAGGNRVHLGGDAFNQLKEAGVPLRSVKSSGWSAIVEATAIGALGARTIAPPQYQELVALIKAAGTANFTEEQIVNAVKEALREGVSE